MFGKKMGAVRVLQQAEKEFEAFTKEDEGQSLKIEDGRVQFGDISLVVQWAMAPHTDGKDMCVDVHVEKQNDDHLYCSRKCSLCLTNTVYA